MWDEEDGFYYDVLRLPDGRATRLKVRSMVGLLPLCATTVIEPWQRERVPAVWQHIAERVRRRCRSCSTSIHPTGPEPPRATATAASSRSSTRSGCGASSRACSTRTSS